MARILLAAVCWAACGCQAIQNDPILGGNMPPMILDGSKGK